MNARVSLWLIDWKGTNSRTEEFGPFGVETIVIRPKQDVLPANDFRVERVSFRLRMAVTITDWFDEGHRGNTSLYFAPAPKRCITLSTVR